MGHVCIRDLLNWLILAPKTLTWTLSMVNASFPLLKIVPRQFKHGYLPENFLKFLMFLQLDVDGNFLQENSKPLSIKR